MFQSGRRPQPELPPVYRSDDPRNGSKWRPALQRIRRGIFSRKYTSRPAISSPDSSFPPNKVDGQCLSPRARQSTDGREARNPFSKYLRKASPAAPSPERPQSPPEAKDSKAYSFFKRTLTKSRRQHGPANKEYIQSQQHKRRQTDLARPISTVHMPETKLAEQEPLLQRPSTAAYIPQHAATDFKRMSNYGPQFDGYTSLDQLLKRASVQPCHSMTLKSAAFEPEDETSDFQNFLAQSRAEAARTLESSSLRSTNKIMPSEEEKIMGEIEANYRAATSDLLQPTTSASKRLSRSGSFFEKVGDYYKPVERVSMKDRISDTTMRDQTVPMATRASRRSTAARPVSRGENFMIAVGEYIKPSNPDHQPEE